MQWRLAHLETAVTLRRSLQAPDPRDESTTPQTAAIAAARVLDLRHTAPTVRLGAGLLNCRMVMPRCDPNGDSTASSGSKVMPSPATTIWRSVSRLVARKS